MVPRYGRSSPVMALTASKTATCTIAAVRAWANGFWPFATALSTAIAFQSRTGSAFATAGPNSRVAINMHRPKVLFPAPLRILFIVVPPILTTSWSVMSGIVAVEGMDVHIEARVGALCFVSR